MPGLYRSRIERLSADKVGHVSLRFSRDLCEGFGHRDPGIEARAGRIAHLRKALEPMSH